MTTVCRCNRQSVEHLPWFSQSRVWSEPARSERPSPPCSCDRRTTRRRHSGAPRRIRRLQRLTMAAPGRTQGSTHRQSPRDLFRRPDHTASPSARLCPPANEHKTTVHSYHRVTTCHRSWRHRRLETERWPPLKSINRNTTWLVIEQAWHTKFAVIG